MYIDKEGYLCVRVPNMEGPMREYNIIDHYDILKYKVNIETGLFEEVK